MLLSGIKNELLQKFGIFDDAYSIDQRGDKSLATISSLLFISIVAHRCVFSYWFIPFICIGSR